MLINLFEVKKNKKNRFEKNYSIHAIKKEINGEVSKKFCGEFTRKEPFVHSSALKISNLISPVSYPFPDSEPFINMCKKY
jgi:hypothetical protein